MLAQRLTTPPSVLSMMRATGSACDALTPMPSPNGFAKAIFSSVRSTTMLGEAPI
jgi:hypothetical protein